MIADFDDQKMGAWAQIAAMLASAYAKTPETKIDTTQSTLLLERLTYNPFSDPKVLLGLGVGAAALITVALIATRKK